MTLRYVLVSTIVVFTLLNIISVNILHPSVHSPDIQHAFDTAAALRQSSKTDNKIQEIPLTIYDHNGKVLTSPPSRNSFQMTSILDRMLYHFPYNPNDPVENNILQLWKTSNIDSISKDGDDTKEEEFPNACKELIDRWASANPDHEHILLSLKDAEDIVADLMRPLVPEVVDALRMLPHDRLKYEFLKFLLVFLHGGVYADIDTTDVKPIKHWYKLSTLPTKVWLGIDADLNSPDWADHYSRRLSFTPSIFRAKAYHPLIARIIARITFIIYSQNDLIKSIDWEKEFSDVDASGAPRIQFTGSSILTDSAFEYMNTLHQFVFFTSLKNSNLDQSSIQLNREIFGPNVDADQKFSYKIFTMLANPVQVYDLAVLPKISFTGYDSAQIDFYDDNNEKKGYERHYYGRSKALTDWSPKRLRLQSN